MNQKKPIPPEVQQLAEKVFCNRTEFLGVVDGFEVYAESDGGKETPDPTGLPTFILWDGNKARIVGGLEALPILSHF
ncbi:MAG: hypothetical protein J6W47_07650 [Bacteroidales bacterium]|nr:hypothetical protein [Bacteroidales bacterium]